MRRRITIILAVAGLAVMAPATALASPSLRTSDPRSPDARDAATTLVVPSGVIAQTAPTASSPASDGDGFGWTEVGYGAGGLALVALLGAGAFVAVRRQRRPGTRLAH